MKKWDPFVDQMLTKEKKMVVIDRSQFAMNSMDPSFIPLTNALNEELHGKSSKWKFNKTAFYQQRYEILIAKHWTLLFIHSCRMNSEDLRYCENVSVRKLTI